MSFRRVSPAVLLTSLVLLLVSIVIVPIMPTPAPAAPHGLGARTTQLAQKTDAQRRDKKRSKRADRATALRLAEMMPAPIDGWKSARPRISWLSGGVSARTKYWATAGRERFTIVYETRSRGLFYKHDLLENPDLAKRRGYEVREVQGQKALVRDAPLRKEIRIWLEDKVLVLAIGPAKLETMEEHLKAVDFKKVGAVK